MNEDIKALERVIDIIERSDLFRRDDQVSVLMVLYRLRNYELTRRPKNADDQLKHPM